MAIVFNMAPVNREMMAEKSAHPAIISGAILLMDPAYIQSLNTGMEKRPDMIKSLPVTIL